MLRALVRPNGSASLIAPMKLDSGHDEGVCTFIGGTDLVDYLGFKHDEELQANDVKDLLQSLYRRPRHQRACSRIAARRFAFHTRRQRSGCRNRLGVAHLG